VIGVATTGQIQTLGFKQGSTACKRRMTKLHRAGRVRRLERASVNAPYVYYSPRRRPPSGSLLEHNLGVSEIYVRVMRATRELSWELKAWLGPDELPPLLSGQGKLAPDAYFRIERRLGGEPKSSGFFLEHEHTVRSSSVLASKLARYADLYYSGSYRQHFGIRGMRVLVVYGARPAAGRTDRIKSGLAAVRRVGFDLVRFSVLETIVSAAPNDLLLAPLWSQPDQPSPRPLFTKEGDQDVHDGGGP
jgi:hypothetical protein